MRSIFLLFCIAAFTIGAFGQDETAPLTELKFDYHDWTFKDIESDKDVNLRKAVAGKKLVLVFYWAPWGHNTRHDIDFIQSLHDKYKDKGFDIIGVGEYDPVERMRVFASHNRLTFTNVYESTTSAARSTTTHYKQRRESGDTRKFGTPWYLFLDVANLEPADSKVIARSIPVVSGELRRKEIESFIRKRLGIE